MANMQNKKWMIKSDDDLKSTIDKLRKERYIKGLDEKPAPYNEILHAAFRFEPLLDIIKKAEFKPRKKAQTFNLFTFIIFSVLVVVFFGGLIYAMGIISDVMHDVGVANDASSSGSPMYVNMTEASDNIFGSQYQSIQALRMVALVYILGLAAVILLTNVFIKRHPLLFFVNVLISILAVVFAPAVSNAYEILLNSGVYEGGLQAFSASNFLILNLPTIVLVIGLLGLVLSLINLIRTGGEDTNI